MKAPVLEIAGVGKSFGSLTVVDDVSLSVMPGARHLLLGPNGAGKTTLFNLIAGDLPVSRGMIRLFGRDMTRAGSGARARAGVGRTFQIPTLLDSESLLHNVRIALLGKWGKRWDAWRRFDSDDDATQAAHEALTMVGLGTSASKTVNACSYGEKRRLELAISLSQRPSLLLLDEPLAGLSGIERRQVSEVLDAIPQDVAIVLIEHDMDIALSYAREITLLHRGRLVCTGTKQEVIDNPLTHEVYLGDGSF
ncbi:ABC transporter ATP-binding protein [Cupriavidus sp. UYPR2.512]|uniref:ABC transporter ATP-binding protein n=1 Tax=Cupriavidus sp. UYPR2.512 TaxID=1080187 RepID=UPI00035D9E1B|nr:ABC transporter ATP-binding protein [Cupriavidus sp. UYPR2.512]UIF84739.1 ABC transporter ATP-binding protein [Cupriavidus necator]